MPAPGRGPNFNWQCHKDENATGRRPRLRGPTLSLLPAAGIAAMVAALLTEPFWLVALVGLGYGAMNTTFVLTEARLQEHSAPDARATVRSVVALFGAGLSAVTFLVVKAFTHEGDPGVGLVVCLSLLIPAMVLLVRLPDAGCAPEA